MTARPHRLLHVMLRVADLERALHFYVDLLGMRELRRRHYPSGRFTLAFLGFGEEEQGAVLELTHNWDRRKYPKGDAFGHLAVAANDIRATCARLAHHGVPIVREPGPMAFDASENIAFVLDPDGYKVEIIERN